MDKLGYGKAMLACYSIQSALIYHKNIVKFMKEETEKIYPYLKEKIEYGLFPYPFDFHKSFVWFWFYYIIIEENHIIILTPCRNPSSANPKNLQTESLCMISV
mgnify:CR=1 FL=1